MLAGYLGRVPVERLLESLLKRLLSKRGIGRLLGQSTCRGYPQDPAWSPDEEPSLCAHAEHRPVLLPFEDPPNLSSSPCLRATQGLCQSDLPASDLYLFLAPGNVIQVSSLCFWCCTSSAISGAVSVDQERPGVAATKALSACTIAALTNQSFENRFEIAFAFVFFKLFTRLHLPS